MNSFEKKILRAREQMEASTRPLFLFDDDPDGLAAFLLLYKINRAGKGTPLKGRPLDAGFVGQVNEYQPDLIVILDKHSVDDDFLTDVQAPVIWLDHHKVQHPPGNVLYINPRRKETPENLPTSYLAYLISGDNAWIAASGVISDWELPKEELWNTVEKNYPGFLPETKTDAPDALYHSQAGRIARLFSFLLKGKNNQVTKSLKLLSSIQNPQELLQVQSAGAQELMNLFITKETEYKNLLNSVTVDAKDPLLVFHYDQSTTSYTTDISNELLYTCPDKVIVVARESNGSYKCSLRGAHHRIDLLLEQILTHINGSGGGHEHACGAVIPNEEFDTFIDLLRAKVQE
jgi:single-stranded DNA-specific DHH superfamily exonuclease